MAGRLTGASARSGCRLGRAGHEPLPATRPRSKRLTKRTASFWTSPPTAAAVTAANGASSAWRRCSAPPCAAPCTRRLDRWTNALRSGCSRTTTIPCVTCAAGYRVVCAEDVFVTPLRPGVQSASSPKRAVWRAVPRQSAAMGSEMECHLAAVWAACVAHLPGIGRGSSGKLLRSTFLPGQKYSWLARETTSSWSLAPRGWAFSAGRRRPLCRIQSFRWSRRALSLWQELQARGAQFLVFPRTSLWWLDYYNELREYLENHEPRERVPRRNVRDVRSWPARA